MSSTRGRAPRTLSLLVASVFALVTLAAPASGHSELVSSAPAQGDTVEAPAEVRLVFNEALIEVGSEVSVTDAAGATTTLVPAYPEPNALVAPLPELAAGPAAVTWRVVSADGHPIEGVVDFTVTRAPEPSPTPVASPSPSDVAPSPSPSISIMPISAPEPSGGLPAWLWAALVAAVLAAAAVAVVTSRRR